VALDVTPMKRGCNAFVTRAENLRESILYSLLWMFYTDWNQMSIFGAEEFSSGNGSRGPK
jgi:hypothetical protein